MLELGGRSINDLALAYDLAVDPQTGGATLRVPVPVPPGRDGSAPQLALVYTAGGGNSAFGAGWALAGLPAIVIDTTEHVPRWDGSDGYALGGEPLVPWLEPVGGAWQPRGHVTAEHSIAYYRVRTGVASVRVEKWVERATGRVHFRTRDAANAVTVFGARANGEARVEDPDEPSRTLTWLPEVVIDPTGNAQWFDYVASGAQRYLARVRYGNVVPLALGDDATATRWCFQVVLDYGARDDAFASHRAGFALRTDRLCTRIASLHDFDELGPTPTLVGELALVHDADPTGALLRELVWTGHRNDGSSRAVPALRMTYAPAGVGDAFAVAPAVTLENVPAGLGVRHQIVDLYGDGLAGILSESDRAWFYKANLGGGQFGAQTQVLERPATQPGAYAFTDVDRDGDVDVARLAGRLAGRYAHDRERGHWQPFRPIAAMPHVEALGGRADWVDLDGDGRPEIVVAKSDRLVWFRADDDGFAAPIEIPLPAGARAAPTVGEDAALDLFFADMDGDGLVDLVRVENGRVEYWPSLGNGRFGDGIVVEGGPLAPEGDFDAARVRFVDLDGSGTADLLYIGRGEITVWTNASGARLVPGARVRGLPFVDNASSAQVLDVLGTGQPCLVWSSPLPGHAALHYLPLVPEVAPRLLVAVDDGLGAETRVAYASSAAHYLRDVAAGRGWSTLLPSHVTVVDRREVIDHVGGTRRVERYAYHDGFFDGRERAFRGFAQVDVFDAEAADGAEPGPGEPAFAAPLLTRTWFHVGVPPWGPHRPFDFYAADAELPTLVAHAFDDVDLAPGEAEDAVRALAGSPIRVERYAIDEHGRAGEHPFDVVQTTYRVRRAQPATRAARAAFGVIPAETLTAVYEQTAGDPRVTHTIAIETDVFDQVLSSADIAYPRRAGQPRDLAAQDRFEVLIAERDLVHVDDPDRFQLGAVVESREAELTGLPAVLLDRARLRAPDIAAALAAPHPHHVAPPAGIAARRTSWECNFYWDAARTAVAPLGEVAVPALLHHAESACFTPELVAEIFGARVDDARLTALGYVLRDGHWWQPDDVHLLGPPAQFLREVGLVASDGGVTTLTRDRYALAVVAHGDALDNVVAAHIDYHLVAPARTTDPNSNVTEVQLDPLGVAVRTSHHGAIRGNAWGFTALPPDPLPVAEEAAVVLDDPERFLGDAATATYYDLDAWRRTGSPLPVVSLARMDHAADGRGGGSRGGAIQLSVAYLDGYGEPLQEKLRVGDRWRVSGHVVYNSKRQPGLEYAPRFASRADFDDRDASAELGAATLTRYDATGRIVGTDFPDGTTSRASYGVWATEVADRNDTVLDSTYRALREGRAASDPEKQALEHAKTHAGTTSLAFLDGRGREVGSLERGGTVADRRTETELDASDEVVAITDPRGLRAIAFRRDMAGRILLARSIDAGDTLRMPDTVDRPALTWDSRGFEVDQRFDLLDRATTTDVRGPGIDRRVEERSYGESLGDAAERNLRGHLAVLRDQSGVTMIDTREPTGSVSRATLQLRSSVGSEPDWRAVEPLDDELFASELATDALGRVRYMKLADGLERHVDYEPGGSVARLRAVTADGSVPEVAVVSAADYDARGALARLGLGNGVESVYLYDPDTERLTSQRARRGTRTYQDITYTYDAIGNLIRLDDRAHDGPAALIPNTTIGARRDFTYDAHYRLTRFAGRVHQALLEHDYVVSRHISLTNGAALERCERDFTHDASGNLQFIRHRGTSQRFTTEMWIDARSNRSLPVRDQNGNAVQDPAAQFDAAGNVVSLAHLRRLEWSWRGTLARAVVIERPGGRDDDEVYNYGAHGLRVRKLATRVVHGGDVETTETTYLGDCERTRIRRGAQVIAERWTSHFDAGGERLARLDREVDTPARWSYLLSTHQGSAAIELDDHGELLSYEEYFPYGGTAFVAGDAARKRYRFMGKERDDVTGLYDYGQRYYAPWMGRWLSPDPIGPEDDLNLYQFALGDPVGNVDEEGLDNTPTQREQALSLCHPSGSTGPLGGTATCKSVRHHRLEPTPPPTFDPVLEARLTDFLNQEVQRTTGLKPTQPKPAPKPSRDDIPDQIARLSEAPDEPTPAPSPQRPPSTAPSDDPRDDVDDPGTPGRVDAGRDYDPDVDAPLDHPPNALDKQPPHPIPEPPSVPAQIRGFLRELDANRAGEALPLPAAPGRDPTGGLGTLGPDPEDPGTLEILGDLAIRSTPYVGYAINFIELLADPGGRFAATVPGTFRKHAERVSDEAPLPARANRPLLDIRGDLDRRLAARVNTAFGTGVFGALQAGAEIQSLTGLVKPIGIGAKGKSPVSKNKGSGGGGSAGGGSAGGGGGGPRRTHRRSARRARERRLRQIERSEQIGPVRRQDLGFRDPAVRAAARQLEQLYGELNPSAQVLGTGALVVSARGTFFTFGASRDVPSNVIVRLPRSQGVRAGVRRGQHAEPTGLRAVFGAGGEPTILVATRNFCRGCIRRIRNAGGEITGPRTAIFLNPGVTPRTPTSRGGERLTSPSTRRPTNQ